jgi:hypothetical protein
MGNMLSKSTQHINQLSTYLVSRDVFGILFPERFIIHSRSGVDSILHEAHASSVRIMCGGVHYRHGTRFKFLWISIDKAVEEMGKSVQS